MTAEAVDRATPDVDVDPDLDVYVGVGVGVGWLRDRRYDAALDRLVELQAEQGGVFAEQARALALLASRTSREGWQGVAPFDSLLLDVAGSCLLGQVAAGSRLLDAEHLVVRLPASLVALEAGQLRVHQVQVLVEQTRDLTPGVCAEVERTVLGRAGGLCPADLRRLVKRTVLRVDADAAARRERAARRDRKVSLADAGDGMAWLGALLPAEQARLALLSLTEQARAARTGGDGRTSDQLRADLLVQQLTGAGCCLSAASAAPGPAGTTSPSPAGAGAAGCPWPAPVVLDRRSVRPVQVVVHVPLAVALGRSDAPADLDGHGPISAWHARRLLAGAELRRACTDPDTGLLWALDPTVLRPVPTADRATTPATAPDPDPVDRPDLRPSGLAVDDAVDDDPPDPPVPDHVLRVLEAMLAAPPPTPLPAEPRHDPSAPLARLVRTRDVRCDGPGCSMPAPKCELDHEQPHPRGATSAENLRPRSQRCHHAKHTGWTVQAGPSGTTWTSPGGRRYRVPQRGRW